MNYFKQILHIILSNLISDRWWKTFLFRDEMEINKGIIWSPCNSSSSNSHNRLGWLRWLQG